MKARHPAPRLEHRDRAWGRSLDLPQAGFHLIFRQSAGLARRCALARSPLPAGLAAQVCAFVSSLSTPLLLTALAYIGIVSNTVLK